MKVGDSVLYQANPEMTLPAKITRDNGDGTVDLMVFVHPDSYPEFSREECSSGNGTRKGVKEGLKPGELYYKPSNA